MIICFIYTILKAKDTMYTTLSTKSIYWGCTLLFLSFFHISDDPAAQTEHPTTGSQPSLWCMRSSKALGQGPSRWAFVAAKKHITA